ncbi:hypothetical protein [Bdellovibrio sp. HCB274]|uniref:hypothetical protein n=1 Tax=Bdellovibrio sp. HCB274 TaxID=3394361 RepID=UPI0039B394DB
MKIVTEFPYFTLNKALAAKKELAGKTPEEIQTSLAESFKLEGEKLTHFMQALEVASTNAGPTLRRVLVATFAEGEKVPAKAVQAESFHYVPDFVPTAKPAAEAPTGKGGPRKGGGNKGGDKKGGSPWGMSPEELAAKKGKGAAPKA